MFNRISASRVEVYIKAYTTQWGCSEMFKPNNQHNQQSLMESTLWMNPKVRGKLEKSWAPIFYEHVFCQIDEEPFAMLYGTTGNPNFPVNILLSLEYIKHMKDCNDLELLDSFNFDYLVNYAVGIRTLGERNLAERTLYNFRERVYQHCQENPDNEDILFGQFRILVNGFAEKAGVLLDKQRTDTTLFMSNIKKAGRVSLAHDVLAKAVKAIPAEKLTESLAKVLGEGFKNEVLYRMKSQDADSRMAMLLNLCQEAMSVLDGLAGTQCADEARILRRFLSEQAIEDAETRRLAPKPKKEISSGSLQSAYDEDATFRRKGDVSQSGYVLELSETCGKDNPFQLITDYAVTPNNVSDEEILRSRLPAIRENTGCSDMYVDGGFHSDGVHEAAAENGVKIHLTNMSGTQPVKRLPVTTFEINGTTNAILRCPAGHAPTRAKMSNSQTSAHFPHQTCGNCELRGQCHSKAQRKDCVVRINLKAINTGRERIKMKKNQIENTSMRAGIEGSNSALKRKGLRKLAVRGLVKSTIVSGLKAAAQNIKRFIKHKRGGYLKTTKRKLLDGIPMPNPC